MRKSPTSRALLALLVAVAGTLSTAGATARVAPDLDCARPVEVAGLGLACRVGHVWEVQLPGGGSYRTHGHDPLPTGFLKEFRAGPTGTLSSLMRMPSCVSDPSSQPHSLAIYAHASDTPNRYSQFAWQVRSMIKTANGWLRYEASKFSRRVDYRFLCASRDVSVVPVRLSTTLANTTFSTLINDLRAQGYVSTLAKYWVWFDGRPPQVGAAGTGTMIGDSRLSADNVNNFGPAYAATWGVGLYEGGWSVLMHEAGHNFGAVQRTAPRTTYGGHCWDGLDIMCYRDTGSLGSRYSSKYCDYPQFDCGYNDYFNPRPSYRNYLYKNWNLGSPLNRFMSGCTYKTGMVSAGAGGQHVQGQSYATIRLPSSCWNRSYALSAIVPLPPQEAKARGAVLFHNGAQLAELQGQSVLARTVPLPDFDICFYRSGRLQRCAANGTVERGTVPYGATGARIVLRAGARATYVFNAI